MHTTYLQKSKLDERGDFFEWVSGLRAKGKSGFHALTKLCYYVEVDLISIEFLSYLRGV